MENSSAFWLKTDSEATGPAPFLCWDVKQYARMLGLSIARPYILYLKELTAQMLM
jgi:hypothetical protein